MNKFDKYLEKEEREFRAIRDAVVAIGIVAVIVIAALLTSCKTPTPIVQTVETTDTTNIEVRTRDVPVTIEADSASVKALLRCDSAYNVIVDELAALQGARIKGEANVQREPDGSLTIELDCKEDSLQRIIQAQDSIIKSQRTKKETVVVQVEKPISDYYKNTSAGFWILLAILVVIVGFKAYKLYLKIQTGGLSSLIKF